MFRSLFNLLKSAMGSYSYTKHEDCGDPKLIALAEDFKQRKYNEVASAMRSFSSDYRDFGFRVLGEIDDPTIIDAWISESPDDDLPQIILAYQKIIQGWLLRGSDTIDTVDPNDLLQFKSLLKEAKEILLKIKTHHSEFDINKDVCLLTLLKAIDLESRDIIHETFEHGISIDPGHIGLHIAYFVAISEKWGGSREELSAYFTQIPAEPILLGQCIQSIYYWDLLKVYEIDDEETNAQIRNFILAIDQQGIPKDNMYRYELYLRLYWLSSVNLESLEDKYYHLVKPYWDDK